MFCFRSWCTGWFWARLFVFTLTPSALLLAQAPCTKPDAGQDITIQTPAYKLPNAPANNFWCPVTTNPASATINAQTGQISGMTTPGKYQFVLSSIADGMTGHAGQVLPQDGQLQKNKLSGLEVLNNGVIRVGVDSRYGGAITHLASATGPNMVNNFDLGRQIQIGIYDGPVPYTPPGVEFDQGWAAGLGYNPIQAGDVFHNPSEVIAFEKRDNLLYVKTIPKHFHLKNYPGEAYIEHWVRLQGNVVKVHVKMTMFRADKTQYQARDHEFPCMYLNGPYNHIWGYSGNSPFTFGQLEHVTPPMDFANFHVSEPWMAATDANGFGAGLYSPKNYFWRKGYFGREYVGDEFYSETSYVAATPFEQLDHNSVTEFDYELVVGHINDIRSYIYSQPRPATGPNYRFNNGRKGWHYFDVHDTGWPINGYLNVQLDDKQRNQIKSPAAFWQGKDNPKIYIRAAFKTQHDKFRFFWRTVEDSDFKGLGNRFKDFTIQNDDQFHTYEIDLSQTDWMNVNIKQIQFRPPWDGPDVNGTVKIEWVSTSPDGPPADLSDVSGNVCSDTITITVNAPVRPQAGADQVLVCNGTQAPVSATLTAATDGTAWRILSQPASASAVINAQGYVSNLLKPGNYRFILQNTSFTNLADTVQISVPDCLPPFMLTGQVFKDKGGTASNGVLDDGEALVKGVALSLYSDPNGDGDPADGVLIARTTTDANGRYSFAGLSSNGTYVLVFDNSNFTPNQLLWGLQNSTLLKQTSAGWVSNSINGSIPIKQGVNPPVIQFTIGFLDPCQGTTPECVPISVRRLR